MKIDPLIIHLLDGCTDKSSIKRTFKVGDYTLHFDYRTVPGIENHEGIRFGDWRSSRAFVERVLNTASPEEIEELILCAEEYILMEL
jgi:hypothetical protein